MVNWGPSHIGVPPRNNWEAPNRWYYWDDAYKGGFNKYQRHSSECEGQFVSLTVAAVDVWPWKKTAN